MILKSLFGKKLLDFRFFLFALCTCLVLTSCSAGSNGEKEILDIPVAMSTDENYIYPTIVAMTSVMENIGLNTSYSFYIMHPKNLSDESKGKLLSLQDKYAKCSVNLIDMEEKYKNAHIDSHISTASYYRLSLSDLLPSLDKIIWLDGDTLTLHDLGEMFNIDMHGYYYKGFLDDQPDTMDYFGINNDHYICAGVMLINLKELRQDNMTEKFLAFIVENNERLEQHDQTVINVMCYKKIGILPAKYGIFNYINKQVAFDYIESLRTPQKYTVDEVLRAIKDPCILHCVLKPWSTSDDVSQSKELWIAYANKTVFFEEIKSKYSL